jgi:hypothetical protein
MATLKDHQQAMVDLLASGSGIPASASRLAHAMHDVLSAVLLNSPLSTDAPQGPKRGDATTPGLNDKALAADVEACGPKATPAERRVKELENTVKQLRINNAKLKLIVEQQQTHLDAWASWKKVTPDQAGCRKDDSQVCEHNYDHMIRPFVFSCTKCGAIKQ